MAAEVLHSPQGSLYSGMNVWLRRRWPRKRRTLPQKAWLSEFKEGVAAVGPRCLRVELLQSGVGLEGERRGSAAFRNNPASRSRTRQAQQDFGAPASNAFSLFTLVEYVVHDGWCPAWRHCLPAVYAELQAGPTRSPGAQGCWCRFKRSVCCNGSV